MDLRKSGAITNKTRPKLAKSIPAVPKPSTQIKRFGLFLKVWPSAHYHSGPSQGRE
jgi:hypothetical protein